MFILMVVIFVLGYTMIALEHPLKIDKAASALLIGVLTWAVYALNSVDILGLGHNMEWNHITHGVELGTQNLHEVASHFVKHELGHHLIEISEILFFLLGAMTIVEVVDHHQGFKLITDKITTTSKVKLLWILGILTFFMSAALDNLTTTIVMVTLLKKLIDDKGTRWFFASIIVIAANAGGAWSPIGDVTTIMLWIGGQITAGNIIAMVFVPSLMSMIVPLIILTFSMKGVVSRPQLSDNDSKDFTSKGEQKLLLFVGVGALLFVPVFKTVTHLPPYLGMLLGLGSIWVLTEIMHRNKPVEDKRHLSVVSILKKVDVPTVMFFLGILTAVSSLQSAGQLGLLAQWLDDITNKNIYLIDTVIGVLSSIVDNVPLVAGSMGMYAIDHAGAFAQDGVFWELLAYTAGTGGSILIIGSAAGVAAMGMEKIDFIWYMKKISLLAMVGYFAGIGAYWAQEHIVGAEEEAEGGTINIVEEKAEGAIDDSKEVFLESEMFIGIKHIVEGEATNEETTAPVEEAIIEEVVSEEVIVNDSVEVEETATETTVTE
ncbi:MAG: sodium:proton antiporter NhaD [Bacteroidales bacterium]|nr:sodium:proton antiporter NhaD [Bacteroidales bacterium]